MLTIIMNQLFTTVNSNKVTEKEYNTELKCVSVVQIATIPVILYEPCHQQTCLCHMRTTKAQINLRTRAV